MLDTQPTPDEVGDIAAVVLDRIKASPEFDRLTNSTRKYPDCWATFAGYPLISQWDLDKDAEPLFIEGMRVLALKSTVFALTDGDEELAELVVSAPVQEMVHAILAQYTLCQQMTARLGIRFVHMTDTERFGWNPGDYPTSATNPPAGANPTHGTGSRPTRPSDGCASLTSATT